MRALLGRPVIDHRQIAVIEGLHDTTDDAVTRARAWGLLLAGAGELLAVAPGADAETFAAAAADQAERLRFMADLLDAAAARATIAAELAR